MWVVHSPFCETGYINDSRYLPTDENSRERRRLSSRKGNIELKCAALRSSADYSKKEILHEVSLRNIKAVEELLVNYGMEYFL